MKYRFIPHTADIKFQSFGKKLEEAFENAGYALVETITKGLKVKEKIKKTIKAEDKDKEALLYNFLEEFLFLLDTEDFLLSKVNKISIKTDNNRYKLIAEVIGDKAFDYKITNNVKAITYNEIFVKQEKNKWACQVVIDV